MPAKGKPHKKKKKAKLLTRKQCLEQLEVEIDKAKIEQRKQQQWGDDQDIALAIGFHAGLKTAQGLVKRMFKE